MNIRAVPEFWLLPMDILGLTLAEWVSKSVVCSKIPVGLLKMYHYVTGVESTLIYI